MPSAIAKRGPNRRPRSIGGEKRPLQKPPSIGIVNVSTDENDIIIVFDQYVRLSGIPQYLKNGTIAPTAATMSAPNTLTLTYPAGPEASEITIPAEEPSIRNSSGGFVVPTTFPV